jgi:CRISPR-associated protein Cas5h
MEQTLISFDLKAEFGMFKKPDVNDGLQITYNMLHKPALLGILGAIVGLEGYKQKGEFPAYYTLLRSLKIGIEPLHPFHEKGNFIKTVVQYTNTIGYANADGTLIVTEQTLCSPAYRCYIMVNLNDPVQEVLCERIWAGEAAYLPYFGKNECAAWWEVESVQTYHFEPFKQDKDFKVDSVFIREYPLRSQKKQPRLSPSTRSIENASSFIYFERLPIDFYANEKMDFVQYELAEFAYSDWYFRQDTSINDLFYISSPKQERKIVQLF